MIKSRALRRSPWQAHKGRLPSVCPARPKAPPTNLFRALPSHQILILLLRQWDASRDASWSSAQCPPSSVRAPGKMGM
ncbi:hypothetical protein BU26DRAFT_236892 [Trematosphaeria pertusa]|uniref:Uncharacterized protein n=1 Tax=Trematosphaeria pertusa TaxID=390896 RepID=A0A6A6HQJ3_9PLEO|nr:uncharacterized protein BU26DRAFT_236892 [Trematosphaeria pertusa]KAF2240386.1 hypothetical protein BU26DRAFT_236892 [Trematosphaeria pertusa]